MTKMITHEGQTWRTSSTGMSRFADGQHQSAGVQDGVVRCATIVLLALTMLPALIETQEPAVTIVDAHLNSNGDVEGPPFSPPPSGPRPRRPWR